MRQGSPLCSSCAHSLLGKQFSTWAVLPLELYDLKVWQPYQGHLRLSVRGQLGSTLCHRLGGKLHAAYSCVRVGINGEALRTLSDLKYTTDVPHVSGNYHILRVAGVH